MSTNTDLVNQFNDLITAFNTVIFGSDVQDVVLGNNTKPTISKIMRAYMENNGWTPFSTEVELLASSGGTSVKGAYAFDTKKVYRWGLKVPSDPSQGWKWWDEGVGPLDSAYQNSIKIADARVKSLIIGDRSDLISLWGYDSGVYLKANGTTGPNADWAVTKPIPVLEGQVYRLRTTVSGNSSPSVCNLMDASGTMVQSFAGYGAAGSLNIRDITIPSGVSHMKIGFKVSDLGTPNALLTLELRSVSDGIKLLLDQPNLLEGIPVTQDKYISNGSLVDNINWVTTDYIPVRPNRPYVCNVSGTSSSTSTSVDLMGMGVHYYRSDKSLIMVGARMLPNIPFETPSGCTYVKINMAKNQYSANTAYVVEGREYLDSKLKKAIKTEIINYGLLAEIDILDAYGSVSGKYMSTGGVVTSSPNWSMTNLVPVSLGEELTYYCESGSLLSLISGYDANGMFLKNLLTGVGSPVGLNDGKYVINDPDVSFITFSYYHVNGIHQFIKLAPKSGDSGGSGGSGEVAPHRHNGKRWVCFGDSITDHYATAYTYPVTVAAHYKLVLNDGAISGSRTRQAFNRSSQTKDEVLSLAEIITIAHGTNDFKLETPLGTIDDVPTMRYQNQSDPANPQYFANSEYANNSSTGGSFYADYMGLIEHCLSVNKKARMLLITPIRRTQPSANGTDTNNQGHKLIDYVNAVKAIGEKYGIPVQDNYNQSGINSFNMSTLCPDGLHPSQWTHENVLASIVIGRFDLL